MKSFYGMDFSDDAYNKSTLLSMVGFFLAYVMSYKILRKKVGISPEYNCRLVTFAHGIISCLCALYYVVLPALDYYKVVSIPFVTILTHAFGYFTFDLCWCFIYGETHVMKFHHILTVVGLFYYSFKISKQFFIVYAIGLTEITNPFLQVRWFLKHHGMREGILFQIVETVLIGLFFLMRVFVLSYYLYEAWFNKDLNFTADDLTFITLGVFTGYALAIQMYNYIRYQIKKSQKKKQLKGE